MNRRKSEKRIRPSGLKPQQFHISNVFHSRIKKIKYDHSNKSLNLCTSAENLIISGNNPSKSRQSLGKSTESLPPLKPLTPDQSSPRPTSEIFPYICKIHSKSPELKSPFMHFQKNSKITSNLSIIPHISRRPQKFRII